MRRPSSAQERARTLSWPARLAVLLAVAVAAVPAALVTGSELGLTSGALAAAGAHPVALALGTVLALSALTLALERPRSRSLRAYGAQLARRFQLFHAAAARPHHQEHQP
jgi:hypothetical protein